MDSFCWDLTIFNILCPCMFISNKVWYTIVLLFFFFSCLSVPVVSVQVGYLDFVARCTKQSYFCYWVLCSYILKPWYPASSWPLLSRILLCRIICISKACISLLEASVSVHDPNPYRSTVKTKHLKRALMSNFKYTLEEFLCFYICSTGLFYSAFYFNRMILLFVGRHTI